MAELKPYQEQYLALLNSDTTSADLSLAGQDPDAFAAAVREANRASRQAIGQGTRLLREELFPVLDDILSASPQEVDALFEFAGRLISGPRQKDLGLHYRIHLALMNYARNKNLRDMLIRELYFVGMALYNLESMLRQNQVHLFQIRSRMCFAECAAYYETDYDQIQDPEIRGYIHRSMGNVAITYDNDTPESARAKLDVIDRSIRVLSDPDVRAKTPSLPWDLFLLKSHQERTTLLSYLRSSRAEPEAFAQVMESAQLIQDRQVKAARERGEPLQPRWQYAYMAAQYHCGAMQLPEFLEGLYALGNACTDTDVSLQSVFCHMSVPAYYMHYSKGLTDARIQTRIAQRIDRMTRRMCRWVFQLPVAGNGGTMMFYVRQFFYAYRELPGGMPFSDVLLTLFAARQPAIFIRMWMAGRIAQQLCSWAIDDCPQQLAGMPGFETVQNVIFRRAALLDFALQAGRLYDAGMIAFFDLEELSCRDLFEEEEMLLRLHSFCGSELLSKCPSTAPYAPIALGHHRSYDEKSGFPVDFSLQNAPLRPMICLIAVADAMTAAVEEAASRYRPVLSFDEAVDQLMAGEGTRYAPFVTGLMRDPQRRQLLRQGMKDWNREAYLELSRRRTEAVRPQES